MNFYQFSYLSRNIIDKGLKILRKPKLFELYFNEYLKDILVNADINGYIISYPKCGRTWLYNILSLYSQQINQKNSVKNRKLIKFDNFFLKFVHDCSDPSPYPIKPVAFKNKDLIKKKTIILLRDPREIIVSHWHHLSFREKTYKKSINDFINDEYLGIKKIISFYNFLNSKSLNNSITITYEELIKNTSIEIKKILSFLNLEKNENLLFKSINDCSFDKLQKKEMEETKNNDIRSMKFRKGKARNFREDLKENDILKINSYIRDNLNNKFKTILNLEDI